MNPVDISGHKVAINTIAFDEDLNEAVDYMNTVFTEIENDLDSLGDPDASQASKDRAVGAGEYDGKKSSRVYQEVVLSFIGSLTEVTDADGAATGVAGCKGTYQKIEQHSDDTVASVTHPVTGTDLGPSVAFLNKAAEKEASGVAGSKAQLSTGESQFYSCMAYLIEIDDFVNDQWPGKDWAIINHADGTITTEQTCKTCQIRAEGEW